MNQNPFKEKLYHHTQPVKENVWEQIEANLPVQRRVVPFFWLALIGGILLIGFLVIGLSLWNNSLEINETSAKQLQDFSQNNSTSKSDESLNASTVNEVQSEQLAGTENSTSNTSSGNQNKSITHIAHFNNSVSIVSAETKGMNSESTVFDYNSTRNNIDISDLQFVMKGLNNDEEGHPDMSSIKPDPSCYKFSGKSGHHPISVDVFGGPGFSPRKFEDTGGESDLYAQAREATESSQYAWSAGARLNLDLKQGFALRLGLSYEQIGDIFDYTDTSATQQTTRIDSFFAADGTFLYTETSTVTILGTLIKKIHNRYSRLDLPLLVSYELPMGHSILMINAGPVINLTSTQKGQILDPSLVPKHITPGEMDELDAYKTNLGLGIYLGAGALFPLTDNLDALVEPGFLYRIKPVTADNYPLKEHRHYAGLNLGIRYHFN